jgi:DNA-binding NtrC family response regulator
VRDEGGEAAGPPLTILLVDDEPLVLRALKRSLAREGYRILDASDPTLALAVIARENVDVLITDIDMPKMSGVELVAQVRQQYPKVVRILLTGAATLGSALQAINEGEVFRYLTKPWDVAELLETIRAAAARVEEAGRLVEADAVAQRKGQLMEAIEVAFPGLTKVERTDGDYVVDPQCVARGLAHFESQALWALWQGDAERES